MKSFRSQKFAFVALTALSLSAIIGVAATASQQRTLQRRPLPGESIRDTMPDGTRVELFEPASWNGTVILQTFGFLTRDSTTTTLLSKGYAVVQSLELPAGPSASDPARGMSYWKLPVRLASLENVRREVSQIYGANAPVFLHGHSEGGYRVLAAIERRPQDYRGGVAFCPLAPTVAHADYLDFILDPLVAFDYVFPNVLTRPGGTLAEIQPVDLPLIGAIESVTTAASARTAVLATELGIDRTDFARAIAFYAGVLGDLIEGARGMPFSNQRRTYQNFGGDTSFNSKVRRFSADSTASLRLRERFYPLTGKLTRPVLLVPNQYDQTLAPKTVHEYAEVARGNQSGEFVVLSSATGRGHCKTSAAEEYDAIQRVIAWAERGEKPAAGVLVAAELPWPRFREGAAGPLDGSYRYLGTKANGRVTEAPDTTVVVFDRGIIASQRRGSASIIEFFEIVGGDSVMQVNHTDRIGVTWQSIIKRDGDTLRLSYLTGERSFVARPTAFIESGQQINTYVRMPPYPDQPPSELDGAWLNVGASGAASSPIRNLVYRLERGVRREYVNGEWNGWILGFTVDPSANPRTLDFFGHSGGISRRIYELRGDTMRVSVFADPARSSRERPSTMTGAGQNTSTWVRVRSR